MSVSVFPCICLYILCIELLVKCAVEAESLCQNSFKQNVVDIISGQVLGMLQNQVLHSRCPCLYYTGFILHVTQIQLAFEGDSFIPDFCDQQRTKSQYTEYENVPCVGQSSYSNAVTKRVLENWGINVHRQSF